MATRIWAPGEFVNPGDLRQPRTTAPVVSNQLTNPGFETGDLTGWTVGNPAIIVSTTHKFAGTYALKHPDGLLGVYEVSNNNVVPVLPGQQIRAGVRYFRETDVRGRQTLKVVLRWYDASMVTISETEYEQAGGASSYWYDPSVLGTAPANAAYVRFVLYTFQTGTGGSHDQYFDEAFWDYIQPVAPTGLVYKAVQAVGGFTASTEPTWPIVLGNTVVDNEVTWEAVIAARVTWEATPIMKSGSTEPTWPLYVGTAVLDGTVAWQAVSRRVTDERCPNSKEVILGASKIFAADGDIIKYSATINPLDWSTPNDAGYLPFGLQTYGSNPVAALGLYRSNLVAFNSEGFQMWQIDQDPAAMAFLDAVPVGSTEHAALQPVANDLMLLNPVGVRDFAIAGASTNLQAGGVGEAIDPLVTAQIKAAIYDGLGLFWPAMGQYWLFFGPQAFVLTINDVKKKSWSRYVLPEAVDDWTLQGNDLYLRAGQKVWKVDDTITLDDVYDVGAPPVLTGVVQFGDNTLTWTSAIPGITPPIASYELERSIGTDDYEVIATVAANQLRQYVDSIGEPGDYHYRVKAINAEDGDYPYSNIVTLSSGAFANNVLLLQYNTGVQIESTGVPLITQVKGMGSTSGVSTAQVKFGTASYYNNNQVLDNTNFVDASAPDNETRFAFSGPFTMEGFFYWVSDADGDLSTLFANSKTPSTGYFFLGVQRDAFGRHMQFNYNAAGVATLSDLVLAHNTWTHVAITRDADDVVRVFLNGVPSSTQPTIAGTFGGAVSGDIHFTICEGVPFVSADFDGYFDQIRVTRNVCRYTAAFTPPTAPFATS